MHFSADNLIDIGLFEKLRISRLILSKIQLRIVTVIATIAILNRCKFSSSRITTSGDPSYDSSFWRRTRPSTRRLAVPRGQPIQRRRPCRFNAAVLSTSLGRFIAVASASTTFNLANGSFSATTPTPKPCHSAPFHVARSLQSGRFSFDYIQLGERVVLSYNADAEAVSLGSLYRRTVASQRSFQLGSVQLGERSTQRRYRPASRALDTTAVISCTRRHAGTAGTGTCTPGGTPPPRRGHRAEDSPLPRLRC